MANSVVKVTDSTSTHDSLILLVNEDGTVSPSKEFVGAYLSSKSGATNLQVMHINKSDSDSIEVAVDDMMYLPEAETECCDESDYDEIAHNLYNVKLDHDYTPFCGASEEIDELAKTLSILDGSTDTDKISSSPAESAESSKNTSVCTLDELNSDDTFSAKPKLIQLKPTEKKTRIKSAEEGTISTSISNFGYDKVKSKKTYKHESKTNITKVDKPAADLKLDKPSSSNQDAKLAEKKCSKKDRKVTKTIPDDFALFSTPDIIRRVAGKDPPLSYPAPLTSPESTTPNNRPAKIESRSKSFTETSYISKKQSRLSLDEKSPEKQFIKAKKVNSDSKMKLGGVENPVKKKIEVQCDTVDNSECLDESSPSFELVDENKPYTGHLAEDAPDLNGNGHAMTLDGSSLDLDPTLLDNINNELISEDILYQVAQSLVSNTDLQKAIDKSLNEDNLGLDASITEPLNSKQELLHEHDSTEQVTTSGLQKGTQIVRPDGRIVVIPPIERPTTRSRNKKKDEDVSFSKLTGKPLDEEHVSGNELDSSGDEEEEEEESEDDPNKLWCICNQPHNNRFMICCDTCEEWYHGKCVNITKAMGQQMESEGREWICLFCKDPLLKRPQSAAKRIRKASRNSRQSTDSNSSSKIGESKSSCVPCVICQKPSRTNSIFCSEACILAHAQGVERVVVFERATGNMLTGNKAPSAGNLEQWLKSHPGYEVVRSAGKIVTTKTTHQSPKSTVLKKFPRDKEFSVIHGKSPSGALSKSPFQVVKSRTKGDQIGAKVINRQVPVPQQKEKPNSLVLHKEVTPQSPFKNKNVSPSVKPTVSPNNKDKVSPNKITKIRRSDQTPLPAPSTKQENIRENVQKTVFEQLTNRLKLVDDLKLSENDLKEISSEIESQLYKCFGDTGQKYRNKYRSLIFNIKDIKNQTLWRRICEKTINPYQLVRLSPDDLASQELALWRERETKHQLDMIKKSELELLNCNRQYVLKTHKGEQILEDSRPTDNIDNTEVITSLTDASTGEKSDRKRDTSKDNERKNYKHGHKDKDKDKERRSAKEKSDSKGHHGHRSSSKERDRSRKRSRSKDKYSKRSKSRERDKYRRSSHKSSRHRKEARGTSTEKLDKRSKEILEQLVDNKIVPPLEDRLWKHVSQEDILPASLAESDSDHEPTSTVTIPTPPRTTDIDDFPTNQSISEDKNDKSFVKERLNSSNRIASPVSKSEAEEIWRGVINMIDVAQISITAHEVSGDCNGLASELPSNLDIVGRISPDTVWDYIGKMKCSNSKIISIVRLNAINVEEKMPYLALYSYLSSRNRLGVVKSTNKAVKDFYILPLASQKPIPQALLPLSGPGFEEARPALLLGIIVRDKRKRPYIDVNPTVEINPKKSKSELSSVQLAATTRSYTPPPVKDLRPKLPLPVVEQDGDEPYSPEDSDPDSVTASTSETETNKASTFLEADVGPAQPFQPFVNKFDDIPGLDNAALPSSTQEIERQMEKLNQEIEMQKSEINSISQNIATASTEIGTSALASIALPSNLQQILDSIKTIGSTTEVGGDKKPRSPGLVPESSEFTIPLLLPTTFSRHSAAAPSENTIPLKLPSKKKAAAEAEKTNSLLSSLSEEDLIRKAEEMLGDAKGGASDDASISGYKPSQKLPKLEPNQPPIPGLEENN